MIRSLLLFLHHLTNTACSVHPPRHSAGLRRSHLRFCRSHGKVEGRVLLPVVAVVVVEARLARSATELFGVARGDPDQIIRGERERERGGCLPPRNRGREGRALNIWQRRRHLISAFTSRTTRAKPLTQEARTRAAFRHARSGGRGRRQKGERR